MALHPAVITEHLPGPPSSIERVEAWTVSQAADALAATSLTPSPRPPVRGTTVTIDIPLDAADPHHHHDATHQQQQPPHHLTLPRSRPEAVHTVYKRREPIRRDSQKRREALLKGKEGSRRRQRWENDRLLSNPHAEPPLPSDWEVQPTYPRHQNVPYFLAPLWEVEFAETQRRRRRKGAGGVEETAGAKEEAEGRRVMRELRARMKRARGAKGLLQDLEMEVRGFVGQWEEKERELERDGLLDAPGSEGEEEGGSDDEIVFVGRNGAMSDDRRRKREEEEEKVEAETLMKDKLVFQSLVDDHGAAFGRYLVHSIATYYGLQTWSVTTGNPARREAYVGLKVDPKTRRPSLTRSEMPRPLWAVV